MLHQLELLLIKRSISIKPDSIDRISLFDDYNNESDQFKSISAAFMALLVSGQSTR